MAHHHKIGIDFRFDCGKSNDRSQCWSQRAIIGHIMFLVFVPLLARSRVSH